MTPTAHLAATAGSLSAILPMNNAGSQLAARTGVEPVYQP
jgi:hypothetical protein